MATKIIFVSIIEGTTELTFEDENESGKNITTSVCRGDTVKWKVQSDRLIITGIPMKNRGCNIWSEVLTTKTRGEWEGVISETANLGIEGYNIRYTINGGRELEQDPDIDIKPKPED